MLSYVLLFDSGHTMLKQLILIQAPALLHLTTVARMKEMAWNRVPEEKVVRLMFKHRCCSWVLRTVFLTGQIFP
ncbi:uncharacterized protein V6R79_001637 [Siganus canaliculatus]